jgi:anti-sigma regulatory factor (Ser/Thr protein kinase)
VPVELQLSEASHRDHVVHFYYRESELVERVGRYVRRALASDGAAIVVATAPHRRGVESWLAAHGIDPVAARRAGLLYSLDARDTLRRFCLAGEPDRDRFRSVVGRLIGQAGAGRRAVYVYGEMVALLWKAQLVTATMTLESLWHDLGREHAFSLFCGYPASVLEGDVAGKTLSDLCSLHSALIWAPPPLFGGEAGVLNRSHTFPCRDDSPRAARHFVSAALEGWGVSGDLLDDAALIVTELASNALLHARSESTVTVALAGPTVCLSVRDHSAVLPTRRPAGALESSGRGLGMVAAISRRWGADLVDEGKVVWAELPR